ncbi:MAG: hypothetical protein R8L07_03850 [Alphaproteobacteria bacterium]|nr:hypothetical protein [Alphaproteobacteria bacterium]
MTRLFALISFIVLLGGCAAGNTYQMDLDTVDTAVDTDKSVAVATVDLRPYIVSSDKTPDFVGLQRGGFGNPFDVLTTSTNPLAEDVTSTITKALARKGITATPVTTAPLTGVDETRSMLFDAGRDRSLLVTMFELKSDTFFNTALHYDLKVFVFDDQGNELASKSFTGPDNLGNLGSMPSTVGEGVSAEYGRKIAAILNSPEIIAALK